MWDIRLILPFSWSCHDIKNKIPGTVCVQKIEVAVVDMEVVYFLILSACPEKNGERWPG